MTDPAGGVPNQGEQTPPAAPAPPPAAPAPPPAAPVPPPAGGPTPPPAQGAPQAPQGSPSSTAPTFQQAAVEPGPAPGIAYADLVTRIIALVIDGLIVGVPYLVVAAVLSFVTLGSLIAAVLFAAWSAVYFVYTWTRMRATYGQKLQKLECVNASDGATLTQDQAIRRWAFLFGPNALVSIASGIGVLWMVAPLLSLLAAGYALYLLYTASQSPKRQGFHDVQAGTVVVKHL